MAMSDINSQYLFFWGHTDKSGAKKVLSNWFPCEFTDPITNLSYTSMEQYMMHEKAQLFSDTFSANSIMDTHSPKMSKDLGRKVIGFLDDIWKQNAQQIVTNGCYLKFSQNPELKQYLLSTGDKILAEASPFDKLWGIGMREYYAKKTDPDLWPGTNWLGKCLIDVREKLKTEDTESP